MNKQLKTKNGVVTGRGIEWCDYTFNPIAGCFHACEWKMPDGSIANCYAEDVASRVAGAAYPLGFEHNYWHPEILTKPLNQKTPSRVFVGSMADVFGHWVEKEHILDVLEICDKAHWQTFILLTKSITRVWDFVGDIHKNCWIGASTPPDYMWVKQLSVPQRHRWLSTALETLDGLHDTGITTWISAEPLTIDVGSALVYHFDKKPIDWMVIGAASNGKKLYAPDEMLVRKAVEGNKRMGISTFYKGNLRSLPWAAAHWLEEYPL